MHLLCKREPGRMVAATSGVHPNMRPLQMRFADKTDFYFQTLMRKDIYQEITKNPRVELGFWKPGEGGGTVLRVAGLVEWVNDQSLKRRSLEECPFLADRPDFG